MSKYTDIIARLEKATGPDRELDAAIAGCVGEAPGQGWALIEQDTPGVFNMDAGRWIKGGVIRTPKPYTASIDASIALVERMLPGWCNSNLRTGDNEFAAYIFKGNFPHHKEYSVEGSRSRCAAILIALFRALEAQETSA